MLIVDTKGFIENEYQTQQMVMREQDTQLSEVSQTIGVLKNMGVMIGDELDDHHEYVHFYFFETQNSMLSYEMLIYLQHELSFWILFKFTVKCIATVLPQFPSHVF